MSAIDFIAKDTIKWKKKSKASSNARGIQSRRPIPVNHMQIGSNAFIRDFKLAKPYKTIRYGNIICQIRIFKPI